MAAKKVMEEALMWRPPNCNLCCSPLWPGGVWPLTSHLLFILASFFWIAPRDTLLHCSIPLLQRKPFDFSFLSISILFFSAAFVCCFAMLDPMVTKTRRVHRPVTGPELQTLGAVTGWKDMNLNKNSSNSELFQAGYRVSLGCRLFRRNRFLPWLDLYHVPIGWCGLT